MLIFESALTKLSSSVSLVASLCFRAMSLRLRERRKVPQD